MRLCAAIWILASATGVTAAPISPGNLMIVRTQDRLLHEYTIEGSLVQTIEIPYPIWTNEPHDVVTDKYGRVHIAQTEFGPSVTNYLSTYDPRSRQWSHMKVPGSFRLDLLSIRNDEILGLGGVINIETMEYRPIHPDKFDKMRYAVWAPNGMMYGMNGGSPQATLYRRFPFQYTRDNPVDLRNLAGKLVNIHGLTVTDDMHLLAVGGYSDIYRPSHWTPL